MSVFSFILAGVSVTHYISILFHFICIDCMVYGKIGMKMNELALGPLPVLIQPQCILLHFLVISPFRPNLLSCIIHNWQIFIASESH